MLTLSRREGESIVIGDDVTVTVTEVRGNQVRIGIDAPSDVEIVREELNENDESTHDEGADDGPE